METFGIGVKKQNRGTLSQLYDLLHTSSCEQSMLQRSDWCRRSGRRLEQSDNERVMSEGHAHTALSLWHKQSSV